MKVLVIGSGGREHCLAWKISKSASLDKLYIAPGNAGTAILGQNIEIKADDIPGLLSFILGFGIDLVLVFRGFFITGHIGHTALLLMGVMLIILGVQFLSLGLLGELLITHRQAESKDLPIQKII